jgi:DNA (cytosine-5)-methyltransferase 1
MKAVSLFAGCGGFCDGIERAGFTINCAVELDHHAAETHHHNFPSTPLFEGDISRFLASGDDHVKKYDLRNVDLVFGGPPCQGFSQIGMRDPADKRNGLYKQFARVVELLKPGVFLMENVPNLLLLNRGSYRDLILRKFAEIGYANATYLMVNAADFGVPQVRQRIILVGIRDRDTVPGPLDDVCKSMLAGLRVRRPFVVREAIGDLPRAVSASGETLRYPPKADLSIFQRMMRLDCESEMYSRRMKRERGIGTGPTLLHNHHTKEIQERRLKLISLLKPGQKADSLPKEVWNGCRPGKWRRLDPDGPSYTILAQMHRDLSEWVHPSLNRWITVREAARLQSFHDGFVFKSSEWQQLKQIGNAVPPLLAYALGQMALNILGRIRKRPHGDRFRRVASDLFERVPAE